MPDNKKVDDILNEYASDEDNQPVRKGGRKNVKTARMHNIPDPADNIGNTAVFSTDRIKSIEESLLKRPAPSHHYSKFAVSNVTKPNVSYINSVKEVRKTAADLPPRPTDAIDGYDGAVMLSQPPDDTYVPKVRKMSNSTRAKEMRDKRRKKKRRKQPDFTYAVESPDGIYTKPEKKSRKFMIHREADENSPVLPDDNGNIIPLSEQADPSALDIKITEISIPSEESAEESLKKHGRRKRASKIYDKKKTVKDYDSFEDAKEIKRGISEVRENISFRVVVLTILTLFSCYMSMGELVGIPVPPMLSSSESPGSYCWIQLVILILSAVVSFSTFRNGLVSLIKFRADSDGLSALAVLAAGAATVTAVLFNPEMVGSGGIYIYVPVTILGILFNAIGKKLILNRMARNFDYISKERDVHAIVCVEDDDRAESLTRGTIGDFPILATMKKTNFIKDFAKYTYSADTGDRYSRVLSPIIFVFSLLLAATVTFLRVRTFDASGITFGLFVFSASISACSCMAIPLIANIPLDKAAKKYVRNNGFMLGYQSVEDFYDTNSVMVSADSFFPTGTINLCSIKLFSGTKIEDALFEAASLASHGNSVLKELFTDIVADRKQSLGHVENFVYEDSMGLCGWINNRRILLGNRELMNNHRIEGIPTMTKEKEFTEGGKEALYLSVSGNLAAMFIIEVTASTAVVKCMKRMEKKDIAVIVRSVDPFITITRLSALFHYPEELIKIIPHRMVADFEEETKSVKKISASMACSGRFTSFMQLIMGTKAIKKTVGIGLVIQSAAALLGFVLVAMNSVLNAFSAISPGMIFMYQLGCTLLTAIIVKIRKI
ncbi:MAG: hypothetical protein ACI4JB_08360 [Porcipelethomonas sp.]